MHNRIKQIRKNLKLNQAQFGEALGLSQAAIAGYENGNRTPMEAIINAICSTFNVNKDWLLTGEGEMFVTLTRDEEIASFVGDVLSESSDSFKRQFVAALARMPQSGWDSLEQFVNSLIEQKKTSDE